MQNKLVSATAHTERSGVECPELRELHSIHRSSLLQCWMHTITNERKKWKKREKKKAIFFWIYWNSFLPLHFPFLFRQKIYAVLTDSKLLFKNASTFCGVSNAYERTNELQYTRTCTIRMFYDVLLYVMFSLVVGDMVSTSSSSSWDQNENCLVNRICEWIEVYTQHTHNSYRISRTAIAF